MKEYPLITIANSKPFSEIEIDENRLTKIKFKDNQFLVTDDESEACIMEVRTSGPLCSKGVWLNKTYYDWHIGIDSLNCLVLVPVKKKKT
jgi:hypothetical protein